MWWWGILYLYHESLNIEDVKHKDTNTKNVRLIDGLFIKQYQKKNVGCILHHVSNKCALNQMQTLFF